MMIATKNEQQELEEMTLNGLDQTQDALEALKEQCVASGQLLLKDINQGAIGVIDAAESIHQFIMFEQEVIRVFSVDTAIVYMEDDSLLLAEKDMGSLLEQFNTQLEEMDLVGISEMMIDAVPVMLERFRILLAVLRTKIYEHANA